MQRCRPLLGPIETWMDTMGSHLQELLHLIRKLGHNRCCVFCLRGIIQRLGSLQNPASYGFVLGVALLQIPSRVGRSQQ